MPFIKKIRPKTAMNMRNKAKAFGKPGQVTVFIIIGLMVLILFGSLFYLLSLNKTNINKRYSGKHNDVNNYVTHCLEETAKNAIVLAGQQAGYVNISPIISSFSSDPLDSPVFSVNGKYTMPYWLYQDEIDESYMPELYKSYDGDNSIEDQIETYIDENLKYCIDDFKPFKIKGIDVVELKKPKANVIFLDSKTKVLLNYPVLITVNNSDESSKETITDFEANINARVKKTYELAKSIYSYEINNVFLEQKTKDFITIYSAVDENYLPPMYGGLYFDDCSNRVQWFYNDVYNNFKEMLSSNIPFLKLDNTDYDKIVLDKNDYDNADDYNIAQGVFNSMVIKTTKHDYPYIKADISYRENFPLYLDFGNNRQILKPNSFEVDMLFFKKCMFEYRFTYNLKYPVLVSLIDEKSDINGNKFLFQFPMLVVLKDNFPRVNVNDVANFPKYENEPSYECSQQYRLSGDVIIKVNDENNNPVDEAAVYFQCGPSFVYSYDDAGNLINATPFAKRCFIGKTTNGVLKTKLPLCIGAGKITIEKKDYLSLSDVIGDVKQGKKINKEYSIEKMKDVNIVVKKYHVNLATDDNSLISCDADSDALALDSNEDAIVKMTFASNGRVFLARYNNYNKTKIKIAPGKYLFDIMLIRNEKYPGEMTIKKESEHKKVKSGLIKEKTIYYPDHDIEMQKAITGAAYFNFTVTKAMVDSGTIVLYVLDAGKPTRVEDVGKIMMFNRQCSAINQNKLMPRKGK